MILRNKSYAKVFMLMAQRGGAQGIVFLSTLFAARYIAPEEFGQAGLFTSLCSFFAMASSLRFEIRGLVCKSSLARERFFGMAYASNACWLIVSFAVVALCQVFGQFPAWLWLVPFGIMFSSIVQFVLPAQHSTVGELSRLGWMTQVVATVTASVQVAGALFYPAAISLIAGRILAWAAGILLMVKPVTRGVSGAKSLDRRSICRITNSSGYEIFYGVPAAVVSVATLQVPVYVFSAKSLTTEVGIYWLAFNLLFMPYLIVSSSIRPIFLRSISARRGQTNNYQHIKRLTLISFGFGTIIATILSVLYGALIKFALPSEWAGTEYHIMALAVLLIGLIAQTPISFSVSAFGLQRANFIANATQVLVRTAAMLVALQASDDPLHAILSFSISSAAMYAIYIITCLHSLKTQPAKRF